MYKKLLVSFFLIIACFTNISQTFASSYDALVEKLVMKQDESDRLEYLSTLEVVLTAYEKKIEAKANRTEKDEQLLLVIPEVIASVMNVTEKIQATMESEETTESAEDDVLTDSVEDSTQETTTPMDYNESGYYFNSELVQSYIEYFDTYSAPILERREEYIESALEQGYTRTDGEDLADLYVGEAPLSLEQGVTSFHLTVDPQVSILGVSCTYEQQWESDNSKGEIERVCGEENEIEFYYESWLSEVIGYDVYGEYSANHLQVNRYLVDYKQGTIVYAEYANAPMYSSSSYFESDIITSSIEDATNFDQDMYDALIKEWNTTAQSREAPDYLK